MKDVFTKIESPAYIIDKEALEKNLKILKSLQEDTGCRVLLAQKAFSCYPLYKWIGQYLYGTAASGLYEARLGKEEMNKESHVFSAAYRDDEIESLIKYSDHFVFNSVSQLKKYAGRLKTENKHLGIRINPMCSTQQGHEIYDPCAKGSRLGVTKSQWEAQADEEVIKMLDGVHFHTLCEQNADDLQTTLNAVEEQFKNLLMRPEIKWINFGGGHHITKKDYKIDILKKCIKKMQEKYNLTVYIEPGEAVALNAGYLTSRVLDIVENEIKIAILDSSAACHMPDVIEMPYTPPLMNAKERGVLKYNYRLGGPTCLSGDVIGDYSFDKELSPGDLLIFEDMAIYTMVKNNTFNGMKLPSIYVYENNKCSLLKQFGYEDFKCRLG